MSQEKEAPPPLVAEALIAEHPAASQPPDPLEELFEETVAEATEDEDILECYDHFMSIQELDEIMAKVNRGERGELNMYMRSIGQTALLTAEEEVRLAMRIEAGVTAQKVLQDDQVRRQLKQYKDSDLQLVAKDGKIAKDQLFTANLRLVVWMAHRLRDYRDLRVSFMDVVQQGNIGLMRAVEKFDFTKGYKFSTYARWWIRQSITFYRGESYLCRLPTHVNRDIRRLLKAERELDMELGRTPTDKDLAYKLQVDTNYIADLRRYQDHGLYIDGLSDDGRSESDFDDIVPSHDPIAEYEESMDERYELINQVFDEMLPDDIRIKNTNYGDILKRRFGLRTGQPQSYKEIAAIYRIGPEAVRIREKKALVKFNRKMQAIMARGVQ